MVMSTDYVGGYSFALCHDVAMSSPIKSFYWRVCICQTNFSHYFILRANCNILLFVFSHFVLFFFFFLGSSSSVPVTGSVCLCTCTSRLCDDMVSLLRLPNHYFTLDFQRAQLPVKLNLNCYKQATKDIKFLIETVFESLLYYRKKNIFVFFTQFQRKYVCRLCDWYHQHSH